ncbi:nuclear receptor-binding factor 2-like [Neodiprion fabricii]|uniref:nuclear receptor-binding factor 2-like n=1 Tax=Neodiprion fabricii TaxID=2872261 RepID=UPI001ED8D920|nr:nuclear receptor-binding factor 2-like [Neodiprion fabricii]
MEGCTLNTAHAVERRAEALVNERRYEEAARCHEQAAQLFSEVQIKIQLPNLDNVRNFEVGESTRCLNPLTRPSQLHTAIESIQLQRDYHRKQAAFVRMQQVQYEEYKAALETHEKELLSNQIAKHSANLSSRNFVTVDKDDKFLHEAIDRAMDEQDSLIDLILTPQNETIPVKHPKDSAVVLEELRTVNSQLRLLIGTLLNQLDSSQQQIKVLTEQLRAATAPDKESLHSNTEDSSISLAPLPPLAPLEMPSFDFATS